MHRSGDMDISPLTFSGRGISCSKGESFSGSVTFCIIGRNEDGTPLYLENDSPFEHEIPLPENVNGEIS